MSGLSRFSKLFVVVLLILAVVASIVPPLPVQAGVVTGSFSDLTHSPSSLTCFTLDPSTGIMYAQSGGESIKYYSYHVVEDMWVQLANCPRTSSTNGGAVWLDGKIYNVYDQASPNDQNMMTVYDITSDSWSVIADSPDSANIATDGTDIYVLANGSFKKWDVSEACWVSLASVLASGCGGLTFHNGYLYAHEGSGDISFMRYSIATNSWESLASIPGDAILGSAVSGGYYYCKGSYGGTNLYSYDLAANTWNEITTLPFLVVDSPFVAWNNSLYFIQGTSGTTFTKFTPSNPVLSNIEVPRIEYTLQDAPVPVSDTITIADNDDTHIETATVRITTNYGSGQDTLSFVDQNGITGSWGSLTGILSLTGTATITEWQAALQSIAYSNYSLNSSEGYRTITFQVGDGETYSNIQSRDIIISFPPAVDILVTGNNNPITCGDTSPSLDDNTDFGGVLLEYGSAQTFFIRNNGINQMGLTGDPKVAITGVNANDFVVTSQPESMVSPGGSTVFEVSFYPRKPGIRTAFISIASDDPDENPYLFAIQGRGMRSVTVIGATATDKTYDGGTTVTLDFSNAELIGIESGDTVSIDDTAVIGHFADKTVSTIKDVLVEGLALYGDDAANYILTQPVLAASISPRTLTVTATATGKLYDGTTDTTINLMDNRVTGDSLTVTYVNGGFEDKNIGASKIVNVSGIVISGADAANYALASTSTTTIAEIVPRPLTVTATADNKVYDGTTDVVFSLSDDRISGDTLTINYDSARFENEEAHANHSVIVFGVSVTGTDAANYNLTASTVFTSADLLPRPLTVTAAANSKVYDGTIDATVSLSDNRISGDSLSVSYTGARFADKNAGTGKTVTVSGITVSGTDASNYSLTSTSATTGAAITPKTMSITAVASDKVYNGTTDATVSLSDDRLSGDSVTIGWTAARFADKNAGTGKTVTVSGIAVSGTDALNYSLTSTSATTSAAITPKSLSITAASNEKVYDGTSAAAVSLSDDRIAGDSLSVSYTSAGFADKNVGTGKTVTVSGIAIDGTDALNYSLVATSATTTATVTPKSLTISGVTGTDKTYDGTTIASLNTDTASLTGVIDGDDATLNTASAAGTFGDKNTGSNKTVTVSGLLLDGTDAGNYLLVQPITTATITATPLAVTGITVSEKLYDGSIVAVVNTGNAALSGVIAGDTVSLETSSVSGTFDNRHTGADKPVTVTGFTISGTDAANYLLLQPNATGSITKRPVTVSAVTDSKTYDGTTASSAFPIIDTGSLAAGDSAVWTQTFATPAAGTGKTLNPSGTITDGNAGNNYVVTFVPATTGTIVRKELTVTGITANDNTIDGNTLATLNLTDAALIGVISGNDVSLDVSAVTGTFQDQNVGTDKPVTITGCALTGNDAPNYSLLQPSVTADITVTIIVSTDPPSTPQPQNEPEPNPDVEPPDTADPRIIAEVDATRQPIARTTDGNDVATTGNHITVSENADTLTVTIPVALEHGSQLDSFTDSSGVSFENNRLEIPAAASTGNSTPMLLITDEHGDLGTTIIIETGNCVSSGECAKAEVKSIKTSAGFTEKDMGSDAPALGTVASRVDVDLIDLPDNARIDITTSVLPDPEAATAFQLAAQEANLDELSVAYTINVRKTNLKNGSDIRSASITMVVAANWVETNGGTEAVKVIRYDEETGTRQVLETIFRGYDEQGRAVFEGISPDGLSVFALASVKTKSALHPIEPESAETPLEPAVVPAAFAIETDGSQPVQTESVPEKNISAEEIADRKAISTEKPGATVHGISWLPVIIAAGVLAVGFVCIVLYRKLFRYQV